MQSDNCAGQNKNCFVLWYCEWLFQLKEFKEVLLYFPVAGNKKIQCDRRFVQMKKLFRKSNVLSPTDMKDIINRSSEFRTGISAS